MEVVALDFNRNGLLSDRVVHSCTRDVEKTIDIVTRAANIVSDHITMSPSLTMSTTGAQVVPLDTLWRRDGDLSLQSVTDSASVGRITFYDFIALCLPQGTLALLTASSGFQDGVVCTLVTHTAFHMIDGRALFTCWSAPVVTGQHVL